MPNLFHQLDWYVYGSHWDCFIYKYKSIFGFIQHTHFYFRFLHFQITNQSLSIQTIRQIARYNSLEDICFVIFRFKICISKAVLHFNPYIMALDVHKPNHFHHRESHLYCHLVSVDGIRCDHAADLFVLAKIPSNAV